MAPIPDTFIQIFKLVDSYDSSNIHIRQTSTVPTDTFTQRHHEGWSSSHGTPAPSSTVTPVKPPSTEPTIAAGAVVAIVLASYSRRSTHHCTHIHLRSSSTQTMSPSIPGYTTSGPTSTDPRVVCFHERHSTNTSSNI